MRAPNNHMLLRRAVAGLAATVAAARTSGFHASAVGSSTDGGSAAPSSFSVGLNALSYKELFRGQLAPPLPSAADATSTACGPVVFERGIGWQAGSYGSLWLRLGLGPGAPVPSAEVLSPALDEALARTEGKGAVYVGIQELALDPSVSTLLRQRGFRYHHFRQAPPEGKSFGAGASGSRTGEHVYYRWNGDPSHDMVPAYYTSIEGVGGLVLSPDESKVLLIWEYGNWKPITGAVDEGESALGACAREMREEAGVDADASFQPVFVGGWQMARARDDRVNDNFKAFVLRAASEAFAVDQKEVSEGRWFGVDELRALYAANGRPAPSRARFVEDPSLPEGRRKVSVNGLAWLQTYCDGCGLSVDVIRRPGTDAEWTFISGRPRESPRRQRSKL